MKQDIAALVLHGQELQARLARLRSDLAAKTADLDNHIATGAPEERQIATAHEITELRTLEAGILNALAANEAKIKAAQEYDASPEGKAKRKQAQELARELAEREGKIKDLIGQLYEQCALTVASGHKLHNLGGPYNLDFVHYVLGHADELMKSRDLIASVSAANTPEARARGKQIDEQAREKRQANLDAEWKKRQAEGQIPYGAKRPF